MRIMLLNAQCIPKKHYQNSIILALLFADLQISKSPIGPTKKSGEAL